MNYWDTAAHDFDSLYDPRHRVRFLLNRWLRRGLFQRAELTSKLIRDMGSPSVLDIGCGSGRNVPIFLNAGASHVTGIDSSEVMLQLAANFLKQNHNLQKTELVNADFLGVTMDLHADLVVALGVFDYLNEDALPFLRRMVDYSGNAIAFTAPGRSLLRMPLRLLRYKHKGIAIHHYRRKELKELCASAGLSRFIINRVSSSGYFVSGWK